MLTLTLPWPDKALWPNRKNGHAWQAAHKCKVAARQWAYGSTLEANGHRRLHLNATTPLPLTIIFCPPDRRKRDMDGAHGAMKPTLDGIAQALGIDDSLFHPVLLDWGPPQRPGKVLLTIGAKVERVAELQERDE